MAWIVHVLTLLQVAQLCVYIGLPGQLDIGAVEIIGICQFPKTRSVQLGRGIEMSRLGVSVGPAAVVLLLKAIIDHPQHAERIDVLIDGSMVATRIDSWAMRDVSDPDTCVLVKGKMRLVCLLGRVPSVMQDRRGHQGCLDAQIYGHASVIVIPDQNLSPLSPAAANACYAGVMDVLMRALRWLAVTVIALLVAVGLAGIMIALAMWGAGQAGIKIDDDYDPLLDVGIVLLSAILMAGMLRRGATWLTDQSLSWLYALAASIFALFGSAAVGRMLAGDSASMPVTVLLCVVFGAAAASALATDSTLDPDQALREDQDPAAGGS